MQKQKTGTTTANTNSTTVVSSSDSSSDTVECSRECEKGDFKILQKIIFVV